MTDALLLLDFQFDFLDARGRLPVAQHKVAPALAATRTAIDHAESNVWLVVRIANAFKPNQWLRNMFQKHAAMAGSEGAAWDSRVMPASSILVEKSLPSAFSNPDLRTLLARHGVERVTIAGLYAKACLTRTALDARRLGYQTTILTEATLCSSNASRTNALKRLAEKGCKLRTGELDSA